MGKHTAIGRQRRGDRAGRALATPDQQKKAIVVGSAAVIVMRIALTLVAAKLLLLPWLKLIGAALLVYIGVSLLLPEGEDDGAERAMARCLSRSGPS